MAFANTPPLASSKPPSIGGAAAHGPRLAALDGWRAVSILLVLACHMLPLGPKSWQLNASAGLMGMSLFFTLSGFLITRTLLQSPGVPTFLIRRFSRILPLAWLATAVYLALQAGGPTQWFDTLLFAINYRDGSITLLTAHFWSLCVEMHFYLTVAALILILGVRGLLVLPVLALAITGLRVCEGAAVSNMTHLRADEILAGAVLALVSAGRLGRFGRGAVGLLRAVPLPVFAVLFVVACDPFGRPQAYLRPYMGAALIGSTLFAPTRLNALLAGAPARYIAEISFALYVIHPVTMFGWLGSGDTVAKYLKRLISFAMTFAAAHLSTFYFERWWIACGKRLSRSWESRAAGSDSTPDAAYAVPRLGVILRPAEGR